MYNLFNLAGPSNSPVVISGSWNTVKRNLKANVGKTISFYRDSQQAVAAEHWLVVLLHSLGIPLSLNNYRYVENADAMTWRLANMMHMTTPFQYGKALDGVFYGKGIKEFVIGHNSIFNVDEAERDWENLAPVRVLHCPVNSLDYGLPDGINRNGLSGYAVIAIDIPKLAFQYRCWRIRDYLRAKSSDANPMTTQQFVMMYVLPNMLFSQTDYVLFNRAYALATGYPLQSRQYKHPFMLPDWTPQVDGFLKTQLGYVTQAKRGFQAMLRYFPCLYKRDFEQLMALPDVAPTQQIDWVYWITRLYAADFLTTISSQGGGVTNPQEINQLRRLMQRIESNNQLRRMLPVNEADDIYSLMQTILSKMTA